ncbi:MAG TPA: M56 family metallopeptidase [Bryobacteraceae bacterium]|jgi:uncharacterized protein (TIGR03435 family)
MTVFQVAVEWALRSSIFIVSGGLLLRALRVKDPSIRLAAWTAMLGGSLALPLLSAVLPSAMLPLKPFRSSINRSTVPPLPAQPVENPQVVEESVKSVRAVGNSNIAFIGQDVGTERQEHTKSSLGFDWTHAIMGGYCLVALTLLLRLFAGLAMSLRLLRKSRATGKTTEGIEIRESKSVTAPVTLGIVRSAIVLPADWREWDEIKLEAVLAHERAHVQRHDPAVQLVSVIHRALLWHSPLSWFLHKRLVQAAEEASDDAAVTATQDRACYAEVLLSFMQAGISTAGSVGVPMARYGDPCNRVQRILDETTLSRGITRRGLAAIVALVSPLAYVSATAQTRPEFEVADIHVSLGASIWNGFAVQAGNPVMKTALRGDRYEMRQATMLDLIEKAYAVDAADVLGGPNWLEWDRFDVIAKVPTGASADVKPMLQALLEDRFRLVVHNEVKRVPGFALTVDTGTPKIAEADGSGGVGCQNLPDPGHFPNILVSCRNVTMEAFARHLYASAGKPVADSTGLKGAWSFDLEMTWRTESAAPGSGAISVFDALDKQLGLKLEAKTVPVPVIVVDSVNEKPSPNPTEATAGLPPHPEFEVASIRPNQPASGDSLPRPVEILPGGRVNIRGFSLMQLIVFAFDIYPSLGHPSDQLAGAPKWLDSAKFDIVGKATVPPIDNDDVRSMLGALLVDRFKLKTHYEDRPVSAYTLVSAKPKLKKADPSHRTACKMARAQPRADASGPPPTVLICQNVTMAQFAAQLPLFAQMYTHYPVLDRTGITGAWDFTLTYNGTPPELGGSFGRRGGGPPEVQAAGTAGASDPSGGMSLPEAVDKQLGLKLEVHQRPLPVLVIDHIENPTDN